jgi:hypothetical protein
LQVANTAVGKTGKCPACGTRVVIPASVADPDEFAPLRPVAPPAPATATARPFGAGPSIGKPDPAAVPVGAIRFEAVGEAWGLFKEQAGVWIAATLIVGFASAGVQLALSVLMIPISMLGGAILPGISVFTSLGSMALSMAVGGIFLGGMYRMALNQVDGRVIGVSDLIPGTDILPSLAVASVLATLATQVGLLCLVIPGLIIWGLFMFSLPLIVDHRIKAIDAMGMSWTTLKQQWLQAAVFILVLWALQIGGMLLCLVGILVTVPLCVLSQAIVYRGFFPGGGAIAKPVQAMDPDFERGGGESGLRPTGRIPAWAWVVAVSGLLAPVVVFGAAIALLVAIAVTASRGLPQNTRTLPQNTRDRQALEKAARTLEKLGPGLAPVPAPGTAGMPATGGHPGVPASRFPAGTPKMAVQDQPQAVANRANPPRKRPSAESAPVNPIDPVTALVRDLANDDDGARKTALDRLARSTPKPDRHDEILKAIRPFLGDPLPAIRASATRALGAWGNADDVPALLTALDDEDSGVRRAAIQAFGKIKDGRAAEGVARQLADQDALVHNDAVRTLRQLGSIAEGEVVKYLKSDDIRTRVRACQVLQAIGTEESVAALTDASSGKSASARAAQSALKAIASREQKK